MHLLMHRTCASTQQTKRNKQNIRGPDDPAQNSQRFRMHVHTSHSCTVAHVRTAPWTAFTWTLRRARSTSRRLQSTSSRRRARRVRPRRSRTPLRTTSSPPSKLTFLRLEVHTHVQVFVVVVHAQMYVWFVHVWT
jgi:hypothetical protein